MYAKQAAIVGDEFRPGFRLQRSWSWSMATSFFLGEIGAGLFLVSLFFSYLPGLILGLLLTSVGKTAGHLMHMGQPTRAWRAIFKLNAFVDQPRPVGNYPFHGLRRHCCPRSCRPYFRSVAAGAEARGDRGCGRSRHRDHALSGLCHVTFGGDWLVE